MQKRAFDLVASILFFLIMSPVMVLISFFIFVTSGSPVIFRQVRMGKGNKPFVMLKFRSMERGNITSIGRILRPIRLDELPQLYNIIRGEMSLVGPRPITRFCLRMKELKKYPIFLRRHEAMPGLTGLAQIHLGRPQNEQERLESLILDMIYTKRSGDFWFDIRILIQTIRFLSLQ